MARRATVSPQAAAALKQARRWLMQAGAGPNGRLRWDTLRAARLRLQVHPYLGAPSIEQPGLRQLIVAEHRIIYRLDPDTGDSATAGDVRILLIFGPGQQE